MPHIGQSLERSNQLPIVIRDDAQLNRKLQVCCATSPRRVHRNLPPKGVWILTVLEILANEGVELIRIEDAAQQSL